MGDLLRRTSGKVGAETRMGLKLLPAFRASGLPAPEFQVGTLIGGGPGFAGYGYLANSFRGVLPLIERFGITTAAEVDSDTREDRLRDETVTSGVLALHGVIGA